MYMIVMCKQIYLREKYNTYDINESHILHSIMALKIDQRTPITNYYNCTEYSIL